MGLSRQGWPDPEQMRRFEVQTAPWAASDTRNGAEAGHSKALTRFLHKLAAAWQQSDSKSGKATISSAWSYGFRRGNSAFIQYLSEIFGNCSKKCGAATKNA